MRTRSLGAAPRPVDIRRPIHEDAPVSTQVVRGPLLGGQCGGHFQFPVEVAMKIKLHNLIFVGMFVGVFVGLGLFYYGKTTDAAGVTTWTGFAAQTLWWLDLLGPTIFMGALKMIIAPLILASIVAGVKEKRVEFSGDTRT